jgi:hypothetical protein
MAPISLPDAFFLAALAFGFSFEATGAAFFAGAGFFFATVFVLALGAAFLAAGFFTAALRGAVFFATAFFVATFLAGAFFAAFFLAATGLAAFLVAGFAFGLAALFRTALPDFDVGRFAAVFFLLKPSSFYFAK